MWRPWDLQLHTLLRKGTAFPSKPNVSLRHISYCFLLLYRGGLQSMSLSEIQTVLEILAVSQQPPVLNRSVERQVCALPDSYGRLPPLRAACIFFTGNVTTSEESLPTLILSIFLH